MADFNDRHLIDKAIEQTLQKLAGWEPSPCGLNMYQVYIIATELKRVRALARDEAKEQKEAVR